MLTYDISCLKLRVFLGFAILIGFVFVNGYAAGTTYLYYRSSSCSLER